MTTYRVVHETTYRYDGAVSSSYGQVCLRPRRLPDQAPRTMQLAIEPAPRDVRERVDYFGNNVSYFALDHLHDSLAIVATSEVDVDPARGELPLGGEQPLARALADLAELEGQQRFVAAEHSVDSPRVAVDDRVRAYAAASFADDRPVVECLRDLGHRIHSDFTFETGITEVTSTIDDLFDNGAGVCQDFTHLAVACVRSVGLPARYVSGYLETDPPPGRPKLAGSDASHAWASAFVPAAGWVDFDPTNDQFVNDRYVTVGWGRDYDDVPPVKGVIFTDGTTTDLDVSVDVTRL